MGMALYQVTRSTALVDLMHAANHTISIDTVRRIDTSIAQSILDRFEKNGNVYLPDTIAEGRMVHCSCDNIDVLEDTVKNGLCYAGIYSPNSVNTNGVICRFRAVDLVA